jgi:hypothetical protein
MIIDFNIKEWQPNYLAFKDAGNVPAALTKLETTPYQNAALGRRYWNTLGECFIYVKCDCSRGRVPAASDAYTAINITGGNKCWVEDYGNNTADPDDATRMVYNLYIGLNSGSPSVTYYNARALYSFSSTKVANSDLVVSYGLVKLSPSLYTG